MTAPSRAVFLDRDGTLITETGYLVDPDRLQLVPGGAAGVRRLNEAGFATVLVTNQSAIARGMLDEAGLERIHDRLRAELERCGARLDLILYCPHHPQLGRPPYRRACACRKPAPGLIRAASERLGVEPARSWLVGDAERDLEAGRRAGVAGLIRIDPAAARTRRAQAPGEVHLAPDLGAAVELILSGTPAEAP